MNAMTTQLCHSLTDALLRGNLTAEQLRSAMNLAYEAGAIDEKLAATYTRLKATFGEEGKQAELRG